jgi:hypothetical protein
VESWGSMLGSVVCRRCVQLFSNSDTTDSFALGLPYKLQRSLNVFEKTAKCHSVPEISLPSFSRIQQQLKLPSRPNYKNWIVAEMKELNWIKQQSQWHDIHWRYAAWFVLTDCDVRWSSEPYLATVCVVIRNRLMICDM